MTNIKLFADGADTAGILEMYQNPRIAGFTTNPTLMRKAGITDYVAFARDLLREIPDKPISFEVFADEFDEMERQALEIAGWGKNVYVKIPVMNTKSQPSYDLVQKLSQAGVQLNITAMMTLEQVNKVAESVQGGATCFVSVFAGRVADTGIDPVPMMQEALELLETAPNAELLWASPREVLNVYQAEAIGCHIITATNDILKKLELNGKNLDVYSQETVQMFFNDAQAAGFQL
jgi:transaldolase